MNPYEKESYDKIYETSRKYAQHYSFIRFYPIWLYMASLIPDKKESIVDLGSGPGHLGHLMTDTGFTRYTGYDFSKVAIEQAKKRSPHTKFILTDLRTLKLNPATYMSCEVFEHLEDDISLVKRIPSGCRLIFSVPDYPAPNHYRTYKGHDFIYEYYKDVLDIKYIKRFEQKPGSNIYVANSIAL